MKYTLWGWVEGIRVDADCKLWVGVADERIADMSQAARAAGIELGWKVAAALSLVPELEVHELQDDATAGMQKLWQAVYHFTPWIETIQQNGFCAQIAAHGSPFAEVREWMQQLIGLLPEGARLTLGLSRQPMQARALVEWHAWYLDHGGTPPAGVLVQFEAHTLLCHPGLLTSQSEVLPAPMSTESAPVRAFHSDWADLLPIGAAWFLPETMQQALPGLGIHTYGQFRQTARQRLVRMFGREAEVFARWFEMESTTIQCNYPPQWLEQHWQAAAGESLSQDDFGMLVSRLVLPIATKLEQNGLCAGLLELSWQTEAGRQRWQKKLKRAAATEHSLRVQLAPAAAHCEGQWLEQMTFVVRELQPQQAVQSTILAQQGFVSLVAAPDNPLHHLCTRLQKRFPGHITLGLRPSFRELRWRAVADE